MSAPTKIIIKPPCFFSAVPPSPRLRWAGRHLALALRSVRAKEGLVSRLRQGFCGQAVVSPLRAVVCRLPSVAPWRRRVRLLSSSGVRRPSSVVHLPSFSAVRRLSSVVCLLAASAWAGDLAVDNLTVTKDATIMGNMYFSSTAGGTNEGSTATGGTITTNGDYIIHAFTNNGTFTPDGSMNVEYLVVAGGGGGGGGSGSMSGGGGAGGMLTGTVSLSAQAYTVTVGAGGQGGHDYLRGSNGVDSVFSTIRAFGGGGGGTWDDTDGRGWNGGSGGGGSQYSQQGGTGTNGQGFAGGTGNGPGNNNAAAGGGGANEAGQGLAESGYGNGGNGGDGIASSISGSSVTYAGGGGGSGYTTVGAGGAGGGGTGGKESGSQPTAGTNNMGGGGGGGAGGQVGKAGGSGIVIVRYQATSNSYVSTLTFSSNGISQISTSAANVFMGKVGIGTNNPAEQLHVVGNARVDGTNIVSAMTLGGETRTTWPTGNLSASNNLSDITNQAAARANLGLGSAATNSADAFLAPTGNGSQITGITVAQVAGALVASNNLSDVANQATARANLGLGSAATNEVNAFLSTAGGVVNGSLDITGSIAAGAPGGDIPMGVYTNQ